MNHDAEQHSPPPARNLSVFGSRREIIILTVVLTTVAAFRYWLLSLRGPFIDYDETYYLILARNIFSGKGITLNGLPHATYSPFFPFMTGLAAWILNDYIVASRWISAVSSAMLLLPVYAIAHRITNSRTAWFSIALLATVPQLNSLLPTHSRHDLFYMGTEPLYLLLLFGALAVCLTALDDHGFGKPAAAGILFGLAYLTRPEAAVAAVVCAAAFWMLTIIKPSGLRATLRTAVMGLSALAVLLPSNLHLRDISGRWVLFTRSFPAEMKETALDVIRFDRWDRDMIVRYSLDRTGTAMFIDQWGIEPGRKSPPEAGFNIPVRCRASRLTESFPLYLYHVFVVVVPPVLWLFSVPGLLEILRIKSGRHKLSLTILPILGTSVVIFLSGFPMPRYQMILIPAAAVCAASGIRTVFRFLTKTCSGHRSSLVCWIAPKEIPFVALLVLVFIGISLQRAVPFLREPTRQRLLDENVQMVASAALDRKYGRMISEYLPPGATLMTWNPRFAWYADRPWRVMPIDAFFGDWDRVFRYAATRKKTNRIDFMALNVYGSPRGFREFDVPVELVDLRSLRPGPPYNSRYRVESAGTRGDIAFYSVTSEIEFPEEAGR
ncbi:glycosyltransferase family 39 protein [bacterium]|nr:glycosyltransferase family 39 protein [candidate division CSSED10-310 bacterium]